MDPKKEINEGKYDNSVIRDLFDVMVKHEISAGLAWLLFTRAIYLVWKQMDNSKLKPLELEVKAK